MKLLLIDGSSGDGPLKPYLVVFASCREALGDRVQRIELEGRNIHDCIGCYTCWLKTPGLCCFHDEQEELLKAYVQADQVIWTSPVRMGFVSSMVKKANDRMLPLVHPFLKINGDKMGHYMRYSRQPQTGLLLESSPELDGAALDIIRAAYDRFDFIRVSDGPAEEAAHETHHL